MYGIFVEQTTKDIVIAGDRGEVNYSENEGATWNKTNFTTGDILYDAVKFGGNIYTCGRGGGYFVSTNNGQIWQNKSIGTSTTRLYKLSFFDSQNGYTVTNEGKVLYTTNAGNSWTEKAVFDATTLYDINMVSPTVGFTCGSGDRLFGTTDGLTWSHGEMSKPTGQVTGIYMLDGQKGYICGENGAVYKTTDAFRTLTLLTDTLALQGKLIHDVFAFDENNVFAVGQGGLILRTINPNLMTVAVTLNEQKDLLDLAKYDESALLISAANGLVYKLTDFTIPVSLVSFSVEVSKNDVLLSWKTVTETNNNGFEIQRKSIKNNSWEKVAFINGKGNSTEICEYNYTDSRLKADKYYYRLKQIDYDGTASYSDEIEADISEIPTAISLEQNYPNPFNPETNITFSIPKKQFVSLKIYDVLGKEVSTLVNAELEAGIYTNTWNAQNNSSGVYFYQLILEGKSLVKKMNLVR